MEKGKVARPIRGTVFVLASAERIFDHERFGDAVSKNFFLRAVDRLSTGTLLEIRKAGFDPKRTFLIPVRNPFLKDERPQLDMEHEDFHQRSIGLELIRGAVLSNSERLVLKGVGHQPTKSFENDHWLTQTFSTHFDAIPERRFWGGARLEATEHAATAAIKIRKAYERGLKYMDPSLAYAAKLGAGPFGITNPIASFLPLQYAFGVEMEPQHKSRGTPGIVDGRRIIMGSSILKLRRDSHLAEKRIGKENLKVHRIYSYSVPERSEIRISEFDSVLRIPLPAKFIQPNIIGFSAGIGRMLHLLHNKLRVSGTELGAGSIFAHTNIGLDLKTVHPVFFDLDVVSESSREGRQKDFEMALETITRLVRIGATGKETWLKGIRGMFRVYLKGVPRRELRARIEELKDAPGINNEASRTIFGTPLGYRDFVERVAKEL